MLLIHNRKAVSQSTPFSLHELMISLSVYEYKWEIDSLASFLGFSYRYWNMTGDDSFVRSDTWVDAVNDVLRTIQEQQEPTFDPNTGNV